jgi:hypothetical protein
MAFCRFTIDIDETDKPLNFKVQEAFSDGGFTPPFNKSKFPAAVVGSLLEGDLTMFDDVSHPGEASIISRPEPRTGSIVQGRHKSTTIDDVPADEVVLVNTLVKFRAGQRTDSVGVNVVKAAFHVPWVWCEMVVTYVGEGSFKIYGRGSIFPSHAWYFDGRQIATVPEIGDARFPILRGTRSLIEESHLKLFPVLSAGARARAPQSVDIDASGRVESQLNTAPGGRAITATRSITIL